MENKENNSSELKKKLIETIDLLQEILDIANESEDDKMSECKEPDLVDDLLSDSLNKDSIDKDSVAKPKNPCMKHWASTLPESFWEKYRECAIACGDLH